MRYALAATIALAYLAAARPANAGHAYLWAAGPGGGYSAVAPAGAPIVIDIYAANWQADAAGVDWGVNAPGLTLTGRTLGWSPFSDPLVQGLPGPGADLGAVTADTPQGPGVYLLSTLTYAPAAPGAYTVATYAFAGEGWVDTGFNDRPWDRVTPLSLTITAAPPVAIPEPPAAMALIAFCVAWAGWDNFRPRGPRNLQG